MESQTMTKKTYGYRRGASSLSDRLASAAGECVLWTGSTTMQGYGQVRIDGKLVLCHRLAWSVTNGPIPAGMHVCHRCDTPACFNPEHLFLGTNADNVADRMAKGRSADQRGDRNGHAKLTAASARAIKAQLDAGGSHRTIARQFGVSASAVAHINTGRNWSHITGTKRRV